MQTPAVFKKRDSCLFSLCEKLKTAVSERSICLGREDRLTFSTRNFGEPVFGDVTSNLADNEVIAMKSYCNSVYISGEGSFGKVYRGRIRGRDVAIKKIKHSSNDNRTFLENEVRLLQGKEHKNIVRLIAWCIEEEEFYLVYEYVNGCTLQEYLRGNRPGPCLGWKQCLKIIQGIAEGIQFLHTNEIIHVDIKPRNLMLDRAYEKIKIIDFGFSRNANWEGTHRSTDRIIGTKGYWAPEYCMYHKLSYKHDVYSFGIVVLEVITGQKHVDDARGSSQFHIPEYVKYMMGKKRFEEAVDYRIKREGWDEHALKSAMAVAELALRCAEYHKEQRPDMNFVVRSLKSGAVDNNQLNYMAERMPVGVYGNERLRAVYSDAPALNGVQFTTIQNPNQTIDRGSEHANAGPEYEAVADASTLDHGDVGGGNGQHSLHSGPLTVSQDRMELQGKGTIHYVKWDSYLTKTWRS